jgi:hypothetical protein
VDNHDLQYYLTKNMAPRFQKCISKSECLHMLEVEKGRHFKIPHSKRVCKLCQKSIEDEFHFILVCPPSCKFKKRPLLCFSLFCVRVRVGFEPRKLQKKQKKISTKYIFFIEFSFNCVVNAKVL